MENSIDVTMKIGISNWSVLRNVSVAYWEYKHLLYQISTNFKFNYLCFT